MNWKTGQNKQLIEGLLALRTPEEAGRFLRDLLTESEIEDIGKRLETARLLSEGAAYPVIQKKTSFSTTTIARVSKWLQEGEGGYGLVLGRLAHHAHTPPSGGRGLR
jgi:TrpR-related protein YerC/YecD